MLDNNIKRIFVTFDDEVVGIITEWDIAEFLGMFRKVSKGVQWFNKLKTVNVENIMSRNVVKVKEGSTLGDVVKLMMKHDVGGMPVISDHNRLAGIISKTDILKAVSG